MAEKEQRREEYFNFPPLPIPGAPPVSILETPDKTHQFYRYCTKTLWLTGVDTVAVTTPRKNSERCCM
jgi:hypothetical protein